LDAICLALSGRTPRLSDVNKSANEIMSRETGECSAEVTFEVEGGKRYRASFGQRRKGKKPDGELQPSVQELADADSGVVLENRITDKLNLVTKLTGLNFNRFSRSIMLAQGNFNAFLNSAPKDRSPLLEQMTGTEIYGRLSVKAFERNKRERTALEETRREIDSLGILSPEEEQSAKHSLAAAEALATEKENESNAASACLLWLENAKKLETEAKTLEENRAAAAARILEFAPETRKLERALRAMEAEGIRAAVLAKRERIATDRKTLSESLPALSVLRTETAALDADKAEIAKKTEEQTKLLEDALPIHRETRELDRLIFANRERVLGDGENVRSLDLKLTQKRKALETDVKALAVLEKLLLAARLEEERTRADEGLAGALGGMVLEKDAVLRLAEDRGAKLEKREKQSGLRENLETEIEKRKTHLEEVREKLALVETGLKKTESLGAAALGGLDVSVHRENQRRVFVASERIREVKAIFSDREKNLAKSVESEEEEKTRAAELALVREELERVVRDEKNLGEVVSLLEEKLKLRKEVESLASHRERLADNVPCPLCGSLDHPYARGNVPKPGTEDLELLEKKRTLKETGDRKLELTKRESELSAGEKRIASEKDERKANVLEAERKIRKITGDRDLPLPDPGDPAFPEALEKEEGNALEELGRLDGILKEHEEIEKKAKKIKAVLDASKEKTLGLEKELLEKTHEADLAKEIISRLDEDLKTLANELAAKTNALEKALAPFSGPGESGEIAVLDLDLKILELTRRKAARTNLLESLAKLEKELEVLKTRVEDGRADLEEDRRELGEKSRAWRALILENDPRIARRRELMRDRDPDEEENRLRREIDELEREKADKDKTSGEKGRELASLESKIRELERAVLENSASLEKEEAELLEKLGGKGFASEEDFENARLSESERDELSRTLEKLKAENARLDSLLEEKNRALKEEKDKNLTADDRETLKEKLENVLRELRELRETAGALGQKLKTNDELKNVRALKLEALERQKKVSSRFEKLNALMGSANGEKFRSYAQSLTFGHLIEQANVQLAKMFPRYRLIPDKNAPLTFAIEDRHQENAVRSTDNLSGGESFMVSLALALGLSFMASENVRVDSLFLDEGFGTLDEEALDMALDALGELPAKEGKTIGVISHVPVLKERIGTRILVTPTTGGRSLLSGPGIIHPL
jgi:exonuclease SbcC